MRSPVFPDTDPVPSESAQWLETHPLREEIICDPTGRFDEPLPKPQP